MSNMKRIKSQNYVSIATTAPSLLGNATNHSASNWWKDIHALYTIAIIISYNSNDQSWCKRNKILLLLPRIKALLLLSSIDVSTKENGLRVCYKVRVNLVYTSISCEFNMQRAMSMVCWMIIEAFNMDDVCGRTTTLLRFNHKAGSQTKGDPSSSQGNLHLPPFDNGLLQW